jgi:hypothetical protein
MKNIFISYRHVEPDQSLAHFLAEHLQSRSHAVFLDKQMLVGTKWVAEIERQIRATHYFIALISKDSIRSDMVTREIKLAHELSQDISTTFKILPIRVAYDGELPYDLGAYLDPIQYTTWKPGEAYDHIASHITKAIEQAVALPDHGKEAQDLASQPGIQTLAQATEGSGAPLPGADPRFAFESGTVALKSGFYVRRAADADIERQASLTGTTTVVKGPRQIGKSSLLVRALAEAKRLKHTSCYLDFQMIDATQSATLESLLQHLARKMAREFRTTLKPDDQWDKYLGPIDNLSMFVENAILSQTDSPVLLILDEADRVFTFPYRDDFFSCLRAWHNNRATNDQWAKLNLVVSHSTEPYLWIQKMDRSPFNVGMSIKLEDFTRDQVAALNRAYGVPLKTDKSLDELYDLVGGHPYLIRQALYMLKNQNLSMSELGRTAISDTGPFGDHLRRWIWYLQDNQDLKRELAQVFTEGTCRDEVNFQRLKAAGLIIGDSRNTSRARCRLYQAYFSKHL